MSMKAWAIAEMERAGFDESDKETMSQILDIFYDQWDSGGAVWAMVPVLQSLLSGRPLSPLTGEDDEWNEVSVDPIRTWQNRRCSSVFKVKGPYNEIAYDLDGPKDPNGYRGMKELTFPYTPGERNLDPVVVL